MAQIAGGSPRSRRKVVLIVVGEGGCGKSSLLLRYTENRFEDEIDPTLLDEITITRQIDGEEVDVLIWEMSGQEDFSSMRPRWYPEADGVMFCINVSTKAKFEYAGTKFEFDSLKTCRGEDKPLPAYIAAGTKADLPRTVTDEELRGHVTQILGEATPIFITSAKDNVQVEPAFESIIRLALHHQAQMKGETHGDGKRCTVQ